MLKKALIALLTFFIGLKIESSSFAANRATSFSYQPDLKNQRSEQDIFDLIIPDGIEPENIAPSVEVPLGNVLVDNRELCLECGASVGICLCNYYATGSFLIPVAQSVLSVLLAYQAVTTRSQEAVSGIGRIYFLGGGIGLPVCTYYATNSCAIAAVEPVMWLVSAASMTAAIPSALGLAGRVPSQKSAQRSPQDPQKME